MDSRGPADDLDYQRGEDLFNAGGSESKMATAFQF